MKAFQLMILVPILFTAGCEDIINPTADFEIIDSDKLTPVLTSESLVAKNNAQNGVKFSWDFGDGNKSTEKEPSFSYGKSGTYQVKLVVENKDGVKRTVVKEIIVLDRILKQLTITGLNLTELSIDGINNSSKVDVFLTIKQFRTKEGIVVDKVVYKTNITNLSPIDLPYDFNVSESPIIDPCLIDCFSFNINAVINGQTYVVGSSQYSGSSFGRWTITGVPLSYVTSSTGGSFTMKIYYE